MAVNFILRSPYLPANRAIHRLDAPSPLAWFQSIWPRLREDTAITSQALLNAEGLYGFVGFVERVRSNELAPPATCDELRALLAKHWYSNNVECRDGYLLVETDDDEVELAFWWVSDEVFLAEQERFACYATDPLPSDIGSGGFDPRCDIALAGEVGGVDAAGGVFCVFVTVWDGGNLVDLPGPVEVRGLRLPNLAGWLRRTPPGEITIKGLRKSWGVANHLLDLDWLALVARHNPDLDLPAVLRRLAEVHPASVDKHWEAIHAGTLSEDELRKDVRWSPSRQPQVVVQGAAHAIEFRFYDGFGWHVWFLFDDLWASAHSVLARSLLRFGMPIV